MRVMILGIILLAGCDVVTPRHHPAMDLPKSERQHNWSVGVVGNGSCVVASTMNLLRWQNRPDLAARLKKHGGGQSCYSWNNILDAEGIKHTFTYKKNDVAFLEKAIAERRGCAVGIYPSKTHDPNHMVCLVDLTDTKACILGDNFCQYYWVDRDEFLANWKSANSWAVSTSYPPRTK